MRSLYIMKITFAILWLLLLPIFCPAFVWAQEQDPFFSAGPRSAMSATIPQDSGWGRDPFSRPFEGKDQAGQQQAPAGGGLTGIICSRAGCIAIIGGETHRVGGMVNGQKVMEIRKRSVVLKSGSGIREEMFLEDFSIRK
jgi:hypothetical protein